MRSESTIRQHRKALGMSVSELSRRVGVTVTAASNWDHGNTFPRAETLIKVAEALGVTPEILMTVETASRPEGAPDQSVGVVLETTKAKLAQMLGMAEEHIRLELHIEA